MSIKQTKDFLSQINSKSRAKYVNPVVALNPSFILHPEAEAAARSAIETPCFYPVSEVIELDDLLAFDGSLQFTYKSRRFSKESARHSYRTHVDRTHDLYADMEKQAVGSLDRLASSEELALYHETKSEQFTFDQSKARTKNLRLKVSHAARWLIGDITGCGYSEDRNHNDSYKKTHTAWFATLTYGENAWHSSDIKTYLNHMNQWARTRGFKLRYVWVAEVQENRRLKYGNHGIHYHIVFWIPRKFVIPKGDTRGWWLKGSTNTKRALSPVGYLLKYASKGNKQGCAFLKGMRTHGSGGFLRDTKQKMSFSHKPTYVKEHYQDYKARPMRVVGGGWVSKESGDFLDSVYECLSINPLLIRKKAGYSGIRTKEKFAPFDSYLSLDFNAVKSAAIEHLNEASFVPNCLRPTPIPYRDSFQKPEQEKIVCDSITHKEAFARGVSRVVSGVAPRVPALIYSDIQNAPVFVAMSVDQALTFSLQEFI